MLFVFIEFESDHTFFLSQPAHARNHNGRKLLKPSTSLDQGLHGKEFSNSNLHDRMERKLSWPCHDQSNAQFLVALKFIEAPLKPQNI